MNIKEKVENINSTVSRERWSDMELWTVKGGKMLIVGSIDFTYGHSLELTFTEIFHLTINTEWKSNTDNPVLEIVEGEEEEFIKSKYQIEDGFIIFRIVAAYVESPFYVVAKY